MRHKKTELKVFVVVLPKEGVAKKDTFGYDTIYKILLYCLYGLYSVVDVIPKEGLAMTMTKTLRSVFS